jgi:hypothetical protein
MNKVQQGIAEAITGVVMGILLTNIVDTSVKTGSLPGYFSWMFGLFNIVLNIVTINSFRYLGLLYTIGWLFGTWMLKDILSPFDLWVNIGGPIVMLVLRVWFWIKG